MQYVTLTKLVEKMKLENLTPEISVKGIKIHQPDINRPALQMAGYFQHFEATRLQVVGFVEYSYFEQQDENRKREICDELMSYDIPAFVFCRELEPDPIFREQAVAHRIPVLSTKKTTSSFMAETIRWLNVKLAPFISVHGVLVDVYGEGVLITGESGVGKSEAALELVKRGHQLVADDVVDICRVSDDRLTGECPEMVRHFMEIRGIGIIDIKAMYGVGAVALSKSIDLVMHMEKWVEGKEYDRLGLSDEYITILGVKVPHQIMPVRPGRNLAIIIEVAARNLSLKRMGYSAAHELDRRLNEMIMKKSGQME